MYLYISVNCFFCISAPVYGVTKTRVFSHSCVSNDYTSRCIFWSACVSVLTNQTTNERYKLHEVNFHHSNTDNSNDPCDNSTGSGNRKKRRVGRNIKTDDPVKVDLSVYRPYSRGYMKNAMEVFLPHNFIQSKIKQT